MIDAFKLLNEKFSNAKFKISLEVNNDIVAQGEASINILANGSEYGVNFSEEVHKAMCLQYLRHMNIIDDFGELIPTAPNEPKNFFDK